MKTKGLSLFIGLALSLPLSSVLSEVNLVVALAPTETPLYQAEGRVDQRNYEGANLKLANFSGKNAFGSNFRHANLDFANLRGANLAQADLTGVSLKLTLIENTSFQAVKGLTAAQLNEACLFKLDENTFEVEGFDPKAYKQPAACQLWSHVPKA